MTVLAAAPSAALEAVAGAVPALREIGDIKRIRVADIQGSLADRGFLRAWARLTTGQDVGRVALDETARAVAAARLGGIDKVVLRRAGLSSSDAVDVVMRSFDELAPFLLETAELRAALLAEPSTAVSMPPPFASALTRQPRAGATRPGHPRVIVEPPESHGDHCYVTAVYATLLAPVFGAERGDAFLLGLAHHLHNAVLPDSGYTGEALLGDALGVVVARLESDALKQLPAVLAGDVARALAERASAETPLAQTFHAADVLDRVLQVLHHARAAAFTARKALVDLEIVHAGPVQGFQLRVLDAAGLGST